MVLLLVLMELKSDLGGVAVGQAAQSIAFNSVATGMNVTAKGANSVALGC